MLWRLSSSALAQCRRYSSAAPSRHKLEPLHILFCGSDEFSITSLRALYNAKHHVPGLIDQLHVVHRPAKPVGHGYKVLQEVPIQRVATKELQLPTHIIDTFTGWTPPLPISLIIAVSFGLLVPPRVLLHAQHGGLNVHPSLLPNLRGPAPIEHAILKGHTYTGVSVQTLHPQAFDRGTILAQTPPPGIDISTQQPPPRVHDLKAQLATLGAEMLVHVLKTGAYLAPLTDVGWYGKDSNTAHDDTTLDHAPKITKQDRFVDFTTDSLHKILTVHAALGDCWCLLPNGDRLILHDIAPAEENVVVTSSVHAPGIWQGDRHERLVFTAGDGQHGVIGRTTYAGGKKGMGNRRALKVVREYMLV